MAKVISEEYDRPSQDGTMAGNCQKELNYQCRGLGLRWACCHQQAAWNLLCGSTQYPQHQFFPPKIKTNEIRVVTLQSRWDSVIDRRLSLTTFNSSCLLQNISNISNPHRFHEGWFTPHSIKRKWHEIHVRMWYMYTWFIETRPNFPY